MDPLRPGDDNLGVARRFSARKVIHLWCFDSESVAIRKFGVVSGRSGAGMTATPSGLFGGRAYPRV